MTIKIYTDGALRRSNQLLGAWCFLKLMPQKAQMVAQVDATPNVTNNCMEITAVIQGLKTCPDQSQIDVMTDSQYVIYGIENGNRKTNQDLWQEYQSVMQQKQLKIAVHHVYGHHGDPGNSAVDLTMRHMLDQILK